MALMIINNIPFKINNDNIVSETKQIQSVTVEGGEPFFSKSHESLTVEMMFADTDPFFINQISLLKASLELAISMSWENTLGTAFSLSSYIGKDEFLEWGRCSALHFSSQSEDNKKHLSVSFTSASLSDVLGSTGKIMNVQNGSLASVG